MRQSVLGYFLPRRGRNFMGIIIFVSVASFFYMVAIKLQGSDQIKTAKSFEEVDFLVSEADLGIDFCPLCFGIDEPICNKLFNSKVKLRSMETYLSGVGQITWKVGAHSLDKHGKIIIKYLGNIETFQALDTEICSVLGKIHTNCNVTEVVWRSFLNPPSSEKAVKESLHCSSQRLLSKILETFNVREVNVPMLDHQKIHLTTMLNLNQEPLIFRVFPAEHGWPFPRYYGACGRTVVVEDVGLPLSFCLSLPWVERAQLALAVLKIAKRLTFNKEKWALYLTKTTLDSFALSPNGTVKLMDADGIVVVDLSSISSQVKTKKSVDRCDREDPYCVSFNPHELCQGSVNDHNYYVVCRTVLADVGDRKGLLHSPPNRHEFGARLEDALTECASAQTISRQQAVELVIGLLRDKIEEEQHKS